MSLYAVFVQFWHR